LSVISCESGSSPSLSELCKYLKNFILHDVLEFNGIGTLPLNLGLDRVLFSLKVILPPIRLYKLY
jgi:hypothetical protein